MNEKNVFQIYLDFKKLSIIPTSRNKVVLLQVVEKIKFFAKFEVLLRYYFKVPIYFLLYKRNLIPRYQTCTKCL